MPTRLAEIWRHPIKAHGREPLVSAQIAVDGVIPWDRYWAIAHEAADLQKGWSHCNNFTRGAKAPSLMALTSNLNEETREITLHHPDKEALTFKPDQDTTAFLAWIADLMPKDRAAPVSIVKAGARGMTDSDFPSISLNNPSSHRAVSQAVGRPLSHHRWRGNLWVEGLGPWEEFEWIGRRLRIGQATFEVRQRITRCRATMANPDTGRVDADTLGALNDTWGHQDFGVYLTCVDAGEISVNDPLELLP